MGVGGPAGVIPSPVLRSSAKQCGSDLEGTAVPQSGQDSPDRHSFGSGDSQGEEVLLHVANPGGRLGRLHPSHRSELLTRV